MTIPAEIIITDYCDSLVREIDIYTEESLLDLDLNDVAVNTDTYESRIATTPHHYSSFNNDLLVRYEKPVIQTTEDWAEYLNSTRIRSVEAIKDVERMNLTRYERTMEGRNIAELFSKRFCFLLRLTDFEMPFDPTMFEYLTIITDFYLSPIEISFLK